jgi:hypothetical protein
LRAGLKHIPEAAVSNNGRANISVGSDGKMGGRVLFDVTERNQEFNLDIVLRL